MKDNNKQVFFPLFSLFVIFSDELFSSFLTILNIEVESGMKSRLAIFIAVVTYSFLIGDLVHNKISKRNKSQILLLGIILFLYILTGFFYPHGAIYSNYTADLLVYGALSIPAAYVGMRLARGGYESSVIKYLPYFLIIVTISLGYMVLFRFSQGAMMGAEETDVMSYQGASYAMSYCCAYSVYHVFFNKSHGHSLWDKILYFGVIVVIFISAVACIVGGGRGAFVYLVLITAYLVYRILKKRGNKGGKLQSYLMLAGAIVIMFYLANRFQIFESAGAVRVAENLTEDSNREALRVKAIDSFMNSPILGHGLGSVWWEVGFYSHNMIQDFLVEMGIVGTIIMIIVIVKMLVTLIRRSMISSFDMFILLTLLGNLLQDTFSGYWIASFKLFLVFGYVYGLNKQQRKREFASI